MSRASGARGFRFFRPWFLPTLYGLFATIGCSPPGAGELPGSTTAGAVEEGGIVMEDGWVPSQSRPDIRGTRGAVSAGHPLAAAAGYEVLRRGGNAVDAAVTMAGVLAVVRPHMNGVGGDAFALFYDGESREVVALNGSGRAGALATPRFFREAGVEGQIPEKGALSVSVPGAVAAWADALDRFGTIKSGRGPWAGNPVCIRRLPGFETPGLRHGGRRFRFERFRFGTLPPRGGGAETGDTPEEPGPGRDATNHCQGREGRVLQRNSCPEHLQVPGKRGWLPEGGGLCFPYLDVG